MDWFPFRMNNMFSFASAGCTHPGNLREINQDAYLSLPERGVWLVADGVGGHQRGDVASQAIVDAVASLSLEPCWENPVEAVRQRLLSVNLELVQAARQLGSGAVIGSTVAALVATGKQGVCLWAGDSRIYGFRRGRLSRLTRDHSQVEELVARGQLSVEEARYHPHANVIYRAIGQDESLEIDALAYSLAPGDKFLLCTDGLTKELYDEEIAEILATGDCQENCDRLMETALKRPCRDNLTVIVVDVRAPEETKTRSLKTIKI